MVYVEVLRLGLVQICMGVWLESLVRGLLYHGSGALASYPVVWLLEWPGEALVRSGGRFPYRGCDTGCPERGHETR